MVERRVLLDDLRKSERDYFPTTMYDDYALPRAITWRLHRRLPMDVFQAAAVATA